MPGGDAAGLPERRYSPTAYEEALDALSSLIVRRTRADGSNKGDQFDILFDYLRIMELEGPISEMKVIHVAGTKGKGSTCTFTESILRNCGFSTGLFTSPHLIDIRERFQLNGVQISEEKFLAYFWWCWNRLKENCNEDVPMPNYFRFLALLGFKIFTAEHVDVAILEVGLGGKFDATNVVEKPVACGISSLGYDHMEILGNTLREIAGEKAGIFKLGVPAFTTTQPEEAMSALENRAAQLGISLQVVPPLDMSSLNGLKLGLDGDHQYLNAGLAIALCRALLQRTGRMEGTHLNQARSLPEEFVKGLATTNLRGRAQIVPDPCFHMQNDSLTDIGGLTFFLDGAHSPESIEVCAKWFSHAVKVDSEKQSSLVKQLYNSSTKQDLVQKDVDNLNNGELSAKKKLQILLFNCMSVRDPQRLLPHLINACACRGICFQKALFVPNQSVFNKVGSHALPMNDSTEVDLSWQLTLQKVWENLVHDDRGQLLMDDHPTLFWTPCAAHCIDLMLHDIRKLLIITKTVKRAIALNGYIYNHPYVLNMMRTFTEQKELIRPGVTRFATVFLTLQSIHNQKNKLRRMFASEEWSTSRYHRDTKGKDAYEIVMSIGFWNNIVYSLRATGPLVRVLRLVDSEKKPAMGYIYEAMDRAKEAISKSFNYNEAKYCEIWEIIDKRWNDQLHRPLHAAGYYLNPEYFYTTPRIESNEELNEGFLNTMARLVPDEAIQHRVETELSIYRYARGVMGSPNAIRNRALWSPGGKDAEPSDKVSGYSSSLVFPSLPLALKWLRGSAQENTSVHFQVLVTGSLHLVGDMLRLLEK